MPNVSNDDLLRITDKDLVVVYKRRVSDIKKEADAKQEMVSLQMHKKYLSRRRSTQIFRLT